MSLKVENLGKNMAELTITVSAEEFDKALTESFQKIKVSLIYRVLEKEKQQEAWLKNFMARVLYTKMLLI